MEHRLVCWECPALFVPYSYQLARAAKRLPVFCGHPCRARWQAKYGVKAYGKVHRPFMARVRRATKAPVYWKGMGKPVMPWWKRPIRRNSHD